MILYTSGTTGRPKGVVTTHANIAAQIASPGGRVGMVARTTAHLAVSAAAPRARDHQRCCVVRCGRGRACEMLPRFDANVVWDRLAGGRMTLFMAVPTIYAKLIAAWDSGLAGAARELSQASLGVALMVSGSAALPVSTLERWKRDHRPHSARALRHDRNRHGAVEPAAWRARTGKRRRALTRCRGPACRRAWRSSCPGHAGGNRSPRPSGVRGVLGQTRRDARRFPRWLVLTGDTAVVENGIYRILGRTNIDILKTGGHKVSALEIEEVLRQHPAVAECAVVGVQDPEWGERVAAAVVLKDGGALDLQSLRTWARDFLAAYKLPSRLRVLETLPRNAMGKVMKPALAPLFQMINGDAAAN